MRLPVILLASMFAMPLLAGTSTINPTTTNHDDSCDIAVQPAATLLLPYFEVDFKSPQTTATQTLFTVQNVSPLPQIARRARRRARATGGSRCHRSSRRASSTAAPTRSTPR